MSEANKRTAVRFIEAFSRGDAEDAAACLTPDAVVVSKGFGKLSGERGHDAIVANAGAFKQLIPSGLRPSFKSVTGEGDHVAVEFEGDAVLANGVPYANQYCMVFTFEDGLIRHLNEYYCTILADERIGPLLMAAESGSSD